MDHIQVISDQLKSHITTTKEQFLKDLMVQCNITDPKEIRLVFHQPTKNHFICYGPFIWKEVVEMQGMNVKYKIVPVGSFTE